MRHCLIQTVNLFLITGLIYLLSKYDNCNFAYIYLNQSIIINHCLLLIVTFVAAGIPADALLKQNYPGLGASLPGHLHTNSHPATELLLERERQIAQERDRALR